MIWFCLILGCCLNTFAYAVRGVIVSSYVGVARLGTEYKLGLLHFSLQLSSVDCALIWNELLVRLAGVCLVDRSLVRTT